MAGRLVLCGAYGTFKGKKYLIHQGQSVCIGRSHSCDICLDASSSKKDEKHEEQEGRQFQTISRKHLQITFKSETNVELEDLSANGTVVDGEKIDKIVLTDVATEVHVILLGTREKFTLEWEPL